MLGTRYEEYKHLNGKLPFVFHVGLKRTPYNSSKEQNWHENLEIQLCTEGQGSVLLDGTRYDFCEDDIVVVNSNVIHYTGTDSHLTYSCLIVSSEFCTQVGLDCGSLLFSPHIKSEVVSGLLSELTTAYSDLTTPCRTAKLTEILLKILIELAEHHSCENIMSSQKSRFFENVKAAVKYIRENYGHKITLDDIAKAVLVDKYALCREFKRLTGQTIVENINRYRCIMAAEHLANGLSVAGAAALCGFDNLSFFTKTFKKYTSMLPSDCKKA